MITEHKILSYTIDSHPDQKKVFDWIRNNWHDLGEFELNDFLVSFKALAQRLDVSCDYCFGIVPDRGEYLKLIGNITQEQIDALNPDDLDLTGCCWDYNLIKALKEVDLEDWENGYVNICHALKDLHEAGEYLYSDEALREMCEANEYQFLDNGEHYA